MENTITGRIKVIGKNNKENSIMKTIKRLLKGSNRHKRAAASGCKDLRECEARRESAKDYIRSEWTLR